MKKNIENWIFPLFILGALLMLTNCKKEVTKKDPIIKWANPADITYGTLLNATQLNATADVPGTFVYTPAIGSKLNVGTNQDLKVDFMPTDASNNNLATKSVKINVIATAVSGPNVTDVDGNLYHSVIIGTQTWMVENLRTTKYNDNTAIPKVTSGIAWAALTTPGVCTYNNTSNSDTINTYGRLYNWYAVNTGKLAPSGWHVPTDAEWTTFENYLIANGYNYDGSITGNNSAKAIATVTGWNASSNKGTVGNTDYSAKRNVSGFSALPGGYRNGIGTFGNIGTNGTWWSSTDTSFAWVMALYYDYSGVSRASFLENLGFSVRCVRN